MRSSIFSSEARWVGRLPAALLATLVLFGLSERAIWSFRPWLEFCRRYVPPYRASDPLRTAVQIRLLPEGGPPPIVLVGSSQIHEGMECEPFEARFPGRPCINLGIAGGTPLDVLFLADRLDARVVHRTLITGVFPQVMHREPKAAFTDWSTIRCLYRGGALLRLTPTEWLDEMLFGALEDVSETLRVKDSLKDMWDVVGGDLPAALRFGLPPQPPRTLDQRPPRGRGFFRRLMGKVDPAIAPGRFTQAQETALEEVIAREARRGNKMIVIDFPARRGYDTTVAAETLERHKHLVEGLVARGGVFVVRPGDLPPLEDDDFHDFTHLRASGRRKVSARIAEILLRIGG
jgi:hypothetical protein